MQTGKSSEIPIKLGILCESGGTRRTGPVSKRTGGCPGSRPRPGQSILNYSAYLGPVTPASQPQAPSQAGPASQSSQRRVSQSPVNPAS